MRELMTLQQLAHVRQRIEREIGVGRDESKTAAGPQQIETEFSEVNVNVVMVATAAKQTPGPLLIDENVPANVGRISKHGIEAAFRVRVRRAVGMIEHIRELKLPMKRIQSFA